MNLHMAQESLKEYEDILAELTTERDGLQAGLQSGVKSLEVSEHALGEARAQIEQHALETEHKAAVRREEVERMSAIRDLVVIIAEQRRISIRRASQLQVMTCKLGQATSSIHQLQNTVSLLESGKTETSELKCQIMDLEALRSEMASELSSARDQVNSVRNQAVSCEMAVKEARTNQAAAEEVSRINASLSTRLAELQAEATSSSDKAKALDADVESLLAKLAKAEKARTDAVASTETEIISMTSRLAGLDMAENRVKALESELDSLIHDIASSDQAQAEAIASAEERIDGLTKMQRDRESNIASLESQLAARNIELNALSAEGLQIKDEMMRLASRLAEAEADLRAGQGTIDDLRGTCLHATEESTASAIVQEGLQSQIAELHEKLSEMGTLELALRGDVAVLTDQREKTGLTLLSASREVDDIRKARAEQEAVSRELRANIEQLEKDAWRSGNMLEVKDVETQKL